MRVAALLPLALLAACNPPAADDYVARVGVGGREAPSPPIVTPDTTGAVWVPSPANPLRLLYGKPSEPVLFALECVQGPREPVLEYTRFAAADPHAKAILALIGNGYVARLKIDAAREGNRWLWRGSEPATSPNFEGLTGARQVEATVPGAGSLILNPSQMPGGLIDRCRSLAPPASPASAPAVVVPPGPTQPDTTNTVAPPPPPVR
jgi:hypothetical protein